MEYAVGIGLGHIDTKFHKDWFSRSNVDRGTHRHTDRIEGKRRLKTLIIHYKPV
jgi:hypothetical protein